MLATDEAFEQRPSFATAAAFLGGAMRQHRLDGDLEALEARLKRLGSYLRACGERTDEARVACTAPTGCTGWCQGLAHHRKSKAS